MTHARFNSATIDKAVNALCDYLEKQKADDNTERLWDEEQDINLLIEPKVVARKADSFNSLRIPLAHSLRSDSDAEVCIITRTSDVSKWTEVILEKHPVRGVTKIMSVAEFERNFTTQGSRVSLAELFDLFILHPAVVIKVASKLTPFLRNANKSCGVLPDAFDLLCLGDADNPLRPRRFGKTTKSEGTDYALRLAQMIAKYRDSTFLMNFARDFKMVKVGDSRMARKELRENVQSAMDYALCLLPNGGCDNVLRLSLHLTHTTIQLPFFVDVTPLSEHYDIVGQSEYVVVDGRPGQRMDNMSFARRLKKRKMKAAMKKNCGKKLKYALMDWRNSPVRNLTKLKFVKQCMPQ